MELAEPAHSKLDVHFRIGRIPGRVHWSFWLFAALLGIVNPHASLVTVSLWIAAVFTSIVAHELGHALAAQAYGMATLMKVLGRMGGGEFVRDLAGFLSEFSGMIEDFHRRGARFERALQSPSSSALVVTSSATFSVQETIEFADALRRFGVQVRATLVNRVTPDPGPLIDRAELEAMLSSRDPARVGAPDDLEWAYEAHRQSAEAHGRSLDAIARLDERFPDVKNIRVERRDPAPEDLGALLALGRVLWDQLEGADEGAQ